jgi:Phage integrase, N-terminal SAM-like domain
MTTMSSPGPLFADDRGGVIVRAEPLFTVGERTALAGFLAGYSGLTRDAYSLDLRQYVSWCQQRGLQLFQARRADIECFGREMESQGRARATIARRLCTIAGFYQLTELLWGDTVRVARAAAVCGYGPGS